MLATLHSDLIQHTLKHRHTTYCEVCTPRGLEDSCQRLSQLSESTHLLLLLLFLLLCWLLLLRALGRLPCRWFALACTAASSSCCPSWLLLCWQGVTEHPSHQEVLLEFVCVPSLLKTDMYSRCTQGITA
jgi:hypothetical protein